MRHYRVYNNFCKGCLLLILFIPLAFYAYGQSEASQWREEQDIWYDTNNLVKQAIIQSIDYIHSHPDAQNNEDYNSSLYATLELILILDLGEDEEAYETLAQLSSYHLGGVGSEYLLCSIVRKGSQIVPLLQRELERDRNDCMAYLGAENDACLTMDQQSDLVQAYIQLIQDGQPCSFER